MCGRKEAKRRVRREEEASALRRPFWRPSLGLSGPLLALVQCLSRAPYQSFRGPLQAQSCGKERAPDHDHWKRRERLTTCESSHSSVWYSLSFLLCVDLVRARSTQKNNKLVEKKTPKKNIDLLLRTPFLRHRERQGRWRGLFQ